MIARLKKWWAHRHVRRLHKELKRQGVMRFNVFPGERWNDLTVPERAKEVLKFMKAKGEPVDSIDGHLVQRNIRDLVP